MRSIDFRDRLPAVLLAVALTAGAAALLAVGLVPAGTIHALLTRLAPDGSVSPGYVDDLRLRALICGALLLPVAGTVAVALRRPRLTSGLIAVPRDPILWTIVAIACAARALVLERPLRYDEAFTLTEYATRSPLFFLTRYTHPNNHVFHTLLVWMTGFLGDGVWVRRLPAFLAGAAILPMTYALAERWHDRAAARLSVALCAAAAPLIEYSTDARGYTILTVAFLALLLLAPRLQEPGRVEASALLIAVGAWTIPLMMYAAVAWSVWIVVSTRPLPWRALIRVAAWAAAFAFVLYVPILVVSGPASITSNGNVLPTPVAHLPAAIIASTLRTWQMWSEGFTWAGGALLSLLALATLLRARGRDPLAAALAGSYALSLVLRRVPFERVWLWILPLFLIAAAAAAARLAKPRLVAAGAVALALVGSVAGFLRPPAWESRSMADAPAVAGWAQTTMRPGDQFLLISPLDAPYRWYLGRAIPAASLVTYRFDSVPAEVASTFVAPRRFLAASSREEALDRLRELGIGRPLLPVATFPATTVFEIR